MKNICYSRHLHRQARRKVATRMIQLLLIKMTGWILIMKLPIPVQWGSVLIPSESCYQFIFLPTHVQGGPVEKQGVPPQPHAVQVQDWLPQLHAGGDRGEGQLHGAAVWGLWEAATLTLWILLTAIKIIRLLCGYFGCSLRWYFFVKHEKQACVQPCQAQSSKATWTDFSKFNLQYI